MVLYRSAEIRRHQYTRVTDWSGGLYISPGAFIRILGEKGLTLWVHVPFLSTSIDAYHKGRQQ